MKVTNLLFGAGLYVVTIAALYKHEIHPKAAKAAKAGKVVQQFEE